MLISDVEEFITLLKRILLTMKIKNEKVYFNFSYNERSNNIESNIKILTENEPLKPNNGLQLSENDCQKLCDKNLWKSLREALFRFEQKSQL
jgi:hypothetical protein